MNLICGINPVLEALSAGTRHFDRLMVVKGLRNRRISEIISRAGQRGIPLRFEPRETLDRAAGGVPHQGIIALVSAKSVVGLDDVLDHAHDPALVVVLDGVEDPRNLGAIVRTVEAAGADGVVLPERHSAGLSEVVSRASAGGLEHVRVARVGNLVQALEALKARGVWVVGFDAAGTERWDAVDLKKPVALVFGGEGRGIRRLVREHCDHLVSIPLFGHVGSLNVSVTAGIALYEAVRQRGAVPSHVRPIPPRAAAGKHVVGPGPDDDLLDPGHHGPPQGAQHDDDGEDEGDPERLADLVEVHEDPAWAGPAVLPDNPSRARRSPSAQPLWRGGGKGKRRDRDRDRKARPRREARPPGPLPSGEDGTAQRQGESSPPGPRPEGQERDPNRRRRRKGRRRGPGGQREDGAPRGNEGREPREGGAGQEQPAQGQGEGRQRADHGQAGGPGANGARKRRRRRRRRPGTPGGPAGPA